EDDAAFGFFAGTLDGVAQLLHHGRIEAVAFVGAVQSDKGDLAFEFIGDGLFFAHGCSWFNGAIDSPPRDDVWLDGAGARISGAAWLANPALRREVGDFGIAAPLRSGVAEQRRQQQGPLEVEADVAL